MSKILNNICLNGYISKMVELSDSFVINGITYNKTSFSPNSLDYLPIYSSNKYNEIYLKQTSYPISTNWEQNTVYNNYMTDINDSSTEFVIQQGKYTGYGYILRIKRDQNNIPTITTINLVNNGSLINFISQDSQYIYFYFVQHNSGSYSYMGMINKNTMAISQINLNVGNIVILKETDMFIYFGSSGVNNIFYINKYNKTNNTNLVIYSQIIKSYSNNFYCSILNKNNSCYIMVDGITNGMTDHYISFNKFNIDFSNDNVINSNVNIDLSILPNKNILINTLNNYMNFAPTLFFYNDKTTNTNYINLLMYNQGIDYINTNPKDSAIYTFKIIDDDNWKLVSYTIFNPIIYKSFLPVLNNQTLLLSYENGVHIYNFNSDTQKYECTLQYNGLIACSGIDNNNNIYIQYTDSSVEMASNVIPSKIYADFEEEIYQYNSQDISTNVNVYAKNFSGQYLTANIQLTLFGNCMFTDTGLKTKTITTSNLDITKIPVTITDTGNLQVSTKLL